MFKNAVAPIQAWLLSQGRCVACGMPLKSGKTKKRKDKNIQVTCKCGRIFVKDSKKKTYRRALVKEVV